MSSKQGPPKASESGRGSAILSLPGHASKSPQASLNLLIWTSFAAGLAGIIVAGAFLETNDLLPLAVILGFMIAAERLDISAYGNASVSIGVAGVIAAMILTGPEGGVVIAAVSVLLADVGTNKPFHATTFNFGATTTATAIGAGGFTLADLAIGGRDGYYLVAPAVAGAAAIFFIESILVSLAIAIKEQRYVVSVWQNKFQWYLIHHIVLGALGTLVAVAYLELGVIGAVAFMVPPLMLRFAMKQYVDRTAKTITELEDSNRELSAANRAIRRISEQLQRSYRETLEALMGALDARDSETHGHSARVQARTLDLARELGIAEGSDQWEVMRHGALLHDVGKIAVSDAILRKPGKLTEEEWEEMRKHPAAGAGLLNQVTFLRGAAELVYAHHERWDGDGYPKGLKGESIPLGARLFMVADTYDAMTNDRVYRKAQSPEAARDEIVRCSGSQFDPTAVAAFLNVFPAWAAETIRRKKAQGQAA